MACAFVPGVTGIVRSERALVAPAIRSGSFIVQRVRTEPCRTKRISKPVLTTRMSAQAASDASAEASPLASRLRIGGYFALWYFFNVVFNLINKKTLNMWSFPWTLSTVQLGVGATYCALSWVLGLRKKPKVTWGLIKALALPSAAHCLGHIMSCLSFSAVAISFTHVVKSAEPVFGALCAFTFFGESYPWYVYMSLIPVVTGVALSSFSELTFTWMGFTTAMISNFAFAMRNVFSKITMKNFKDDESLSSVNIYGLISIMSFLMELPLCLFFDKGIPAMVSTGLSFPFIFKYFMASCLLYHLYNEVSYRALGNISPVTFSVGNTFKRVIIIMASILFFKTKILPLNAIGSVVAIAGTFLYSLSKNKAMEAAKTA